MREILFRGKRSDNNEWVYGDLLQIPTKDIFSIMGQKPVATNCRVKKETIGQYTGLTDCNGKKIFEGDVVLMPNYGKGKHKTAVYFKNGKFAVDGTNYSFKDLKSGKTLEVIGNIHDNPELIKKE